MPRHKRMSTFRIEMNIFRKRVVIARFFVKFWERLIGVSRFEKDKISFTISPCITLLRSSTVFKTICPSRLHLGSAHSLFKSTQVLGKHRGKQIRFILAIVTFTLKQIQMQDWPSRYIIKRKKKETICYRIQTLSSIIDVFLKL